MTCLVASSMDLHTTSGVSGFHDLYYTREANVVSAPFDNLCADVRQHIFGFLGFNLRSFLSDKEFAVAGDASRGPVQTARNRLDTWASLNYLGARTRSLEVKSKFPWLGSVDRLYHKDSIDLVNIQLVCSQWHSDFRATVLECDGITIHKAFQLRRELAAFWRCVMTYNTALEKYITANANLVSANRGDLRRAARQIKAEKAAAPYPIRPTMIGNSADAIVEAMLPAFEVSVGLNGIMQTYHTPGTVVGIPHPATPPVLNPVATCMGFVEDFTLQCKRNLSCIRSRDLEVVAGTKDPVQMIKDALMPIALVLQKKKKDGTDIRVCSPGSPMHMISLLRRQGKPVPESLVREAHRNSDLFFMEWEEVRTLLETPHYLLLDLELRPKLDLLQSAWSRNRICDLADHHRKNHSLTVSQVARVSPAVAVLYQWFWDLVAVNQKMLDHGADRFDLDPSAIAAAVKQKRKVADRAANAVYTAEISNLMQSATLPLDPADLSATIEMVERRRIKAQEWASWNAMIKAIPDAPVHTMRSRKFKGLMDLKAKKDGSSEATGAATKVPLPPIGPRKPGMLSKTITPRPTMKM